MINATGRAAAHWESFLATPEDRGFAIGAAGPQAALKARWRSFFSGFGGMPPARLLDIGAGVGPLVPAARESWSARPPLIVCADYAYGAPGAADEASAGGALAICADAALLPFAPRSFDFVVSQFGLEYAGARAFAEATRVLAPSGVFAAVVHLADGDLARECAAKAALLSKFGETGLIPAVREAVAASYAALPRHSTDARLENDLRQAATKANNCLASASPSYTREFLIRCFNDLGRVSERRFAYDPRDALGWIDAIATRLAHYQSRMEAMVGAACGPGEMENVRRMMDANGAEGFVCEKITLNEGDGPAAWWVEARGPEA